jgi:HEAT repeat protein
VSDIFAGLDELPWADMGHAYGAAVEVPGLLRNLVDPDPETREYALDAMYGGVHHQGDVYDSTLAAIPFLVRIAATAGLPGRPEVLDLLASIGGAEFDPGESADEDEEEYEGARYEEANVLVAAEQATWIALLSDEDGRVRQAAARVLPACRDQAEASAAALVRAAEREDDVEARVAYMGILGRIGHSAAYLTGILTDDPSPRVRTAALSAVVKAGGTVPVELAIELLSHVYAESTPQLEPAGYATDTLIGALRVLRERAGRDRRSPEAEQLVSTVVDSYGDRVEERRALVTALLRSPDWESRFDALSPATRLIGGWRGEYSQIVALAGEQLTDPHPALRPRALMMLSGIGPLAAPAADAVAEILTASPFEARSADLATTSPALVRWRSGTASIGAAVIILAEVRDVRVLPSLERLLQHEAMPHNVPFLISDFGSAAENLLPSLRAAVRRMSTHDDRKFGVVRALHAAGAPDEEVLDALRGLKDRAVIATFLGQLGAGQPKLRKWVRKNDRSLAGKAAIALGRMGEPDPVFDFIDRWTARDEWARRDAMVALAALGPAARPRLGLALSLVDESDHTLWTPLYAAEAVWRIAGDAEQALPVLRNAWTGNKHTRTHVAGIIVAMGETGQPLHDLLEAELRSPRRHAEVAVDEQLLRTCRSVVR